MIHTNLGSFEMTLHQFAIDHLLGLIMCGFWLIVVGGAGTATMAVMAARKLTRR